MTTKMLQRRGLPSEWTSENPVLGSGEIGVAVYLDGTYGLKVGDGSTPWNDLSFTPRHLASKLYADSLATKTLSDAKSDATARITSVRSDNYLYTDGEVSKTLVNAKKHADVVSGEAFSESKSYVDQKLSALVVSEGWVFADPIVWDNSTTYPPRIVVEYDNVYYVSTVETVGDTPSASAIWVGLPTAVDGELRGAFNANEILGKDSNGTTLGLSRSEFAKTLGVDARDYGVTGDGVTNDLPGLQAAADALANTPNGGTLHLGPGIYLIDGGSNSEYLVLPKNCTLRGSGVDSTTIFVVGGDFDAGSPIYAENADYVTIADLTINCNKQARFPIFFNNCDSVRILDVEVHSGSYHGIHLTECKNVFIRGVHSHNHGSPNGGAPIERGAGSKITDCRTVKVHQTIFENNSEHGTYSVSSDPEGDYEFIGVTSRNNGQSDQREGTGLSVRARCSRVIGCDLRLNRGPGLTVSSSGGDLTESLTITGNTFWKNGIGSNTGQEASVQADRLVFSSNTLESDSATHSFQINSGSEAIVTNNVFRVVGENTASFIRLAPGSNPIKNVLISGNLLHTLYSVSNLPRFVIVGRDSSTEVHNLVVSGNEIINFRSVLRLIGLAKKPRVLHNTFIDMQGGMVSIQSDAPDPIDPVFIGLGVDPLNPDDFVIPNRMVAKGLRIADGLLDFGTTVNIGNQSTEPVGFSGVRIGRGTLATEPNAIGIGRDAVASGHTSLAIGMDAVASGTRSIALGRGAIAQNTQELQIGGAAASSRLAGTLWGVFENCRRCWFL
jgi:polygalacturonase